MPRLRAEVFGALVVWLTFFGLGFGDELPPIRPASYAPSAPRRLQLTVFINGTNCGLVEPFTFDPVSNRLSAKRKSLEEVGVRTPPGDREADLFLDRLALPYRLDEGEQKIELTLSDAQRLPRIYDAQHNAEPLKARADLGALFDYSLFGGSVRDFRSGGLVFSGANAQLDGRLFSDYGIFEQTGVVGSTLYGDGRNLLRLDSTFTYSDQGSAVSYRAGDVISGGTAWTRPIRLAGVQATRDFGVRSDIVTRPMPQISGSAAAPSTVDVLVNGMRTYTQEVGAGPYSIVNIPVVAAGGEAQIVVRDSTGRAQEQNLSLFNATNLLAPGLADFSLESGFARRNYGALSMDYDSHPIGSATLRYGEFSWLTLETHGEAGAGLANAGAGVVTALGRFGVANLALSGSHSADGFGGQVYLDWQTNWAQYNFSLGAQRTLANYDDLASATADSSVVPAASSSLIDAYSPVSGPLPPVADLRPPRELERAAVSFPLFEKNTSFSFGAVNLVQQDRSSSRLLIATLSRPFHWANSRVYISTYADLGSQKSFGAFAGLSFSFADGISGSVGGSYDASTHGAATMELDKAQQPIDGTAGWRVQASAGAIDAIQASGSYRSSVGQIAATAVQTKSATSGTAQFDGSIAVLGGAIAAGNRVDSSFALVDAGSPGVMVTQDYRPVGRTDSNGKFLLPNLRGYETNDIGIDPTGMPIDFDPARTEELVAPRSKSGVYLKFGDGEQGRSAIVVFVDAAGKPMALGATGHLKGQEATFLVGHDGRSYVRGLRPMNNAVIQGSVGECQASFTFAPIAGQQTVVRGVVCR